MMKDFINKIVMFATSKKLLWIITTVFVLCTVAMFLMNYVGISVTPLDPTYSSVTYVFVSEVVVYSGKALTEKTNLVNTIKETVGKINDEVNEL